MHPPLEDGLRHRPADHGGRDVVKERGQDEDDREQREPALPVVGQDRRELLGDLAVLEVLGQEREPEEQAEQVEQDAPLVRDVVGDVEARQPVLADHLREGELEDQDRDEPGQGDLQRVVVEQRDPEEGHPEQEELERDAGELWPALAARQHQPHHARHEDGAAVGERLRDPALGRVPRRGAGCRVFHLPPPRAVAGPPR